MPAAVLAVVGGVKITAERIQELAEYVAPMWSDVLILRSKDSDTMAVGGTELIRPEIAKKDSGEGLVISVGPQVDMVPKIDDGQVVKDEHDQDVMEPIFQPGDRVVFSRYTGLELNFPDGVTMVLVPQVDIRGILGTDSPALQKPKTPSFVPH